MAVSYMLFYGSNNGVHTASKQHLIYFMTHGAAQKIVSNLEYTPLASGILTAANTAAVKDPGDGGGPCVK
jgi:hypothetical protein